MVLSAQTEPGKKQQQSKQPVSSKAGNKENRNGNDKRKRKEISDEEEEEEEAEPRKNRRKGVQKAKSNKKPRGARGKAKADEEEDDSQDADDTSDGEATKRKNRKKKPGARWRTCQTHTVCSLVSDQRILSMAPPVSSLLERYAKIRPDSSQSPMEDKGTFGMDSVCNLRRE